MEKDKANALNEKLQKFVELRKEFTVESSKVYESFNTNSIFTGSTTIVSGGCFTSINSLSQTTKEPSKLKQLAIAQKERVEKARRYEEYLELQTSLSNYFPALNRLEKN